MRCGGPCGLWIGAGAPILEIAISGIRPLIRCASCAGEAAPDLLPDIHTQPRTPLDMTRIGLLTFEYHRPAREPGEDDDK